MKALPAAADVVNVLLIADAPTDAEAIHRLLAKSPPGRLEVTWSANTLDGAQSLGSGKYDAVLTYAAYDPEQLLACLNRNSPAEELIYD